MAEPLRQSESAYAPGKTRSARTRYSPYGTAASDDRYASIDEQFAEKAYEDNLLKPVGIGKGVVAKDHSARTADTEDETRDTAPTAPSRASRGMQNMLRARLAKKMANSLATQGARTRATAINIEAFSWQGPLWLCVQLPFALLGTISFGAIAALDSVATRSGEGFMSWVLDMAALAANSIAQAIGIDFLSIAANLYYVSTFIIFGVGLFSVAFLFLQYKISFVEPLGGQAAGLKHGLLLLTFIGYALPVANIIPFILFWMAAIWLFPR